MVERDCVGIRNAQPHASFLYHAGLSYRKIERFVERSHVAVHDWYHRLSHPFEVEKDSRNTVVVDETKLEVDGEEVYVWIGIDVKTFTNRGFVSHQTAERFETFEVIQLTLAEDGLVSMLSSSFENS